MTMIMRALALCAALMIPGPAFAQQYPTKPVKIIIPFPAGGVTDIAGRLIAQKLSEKLGQQFYIENIGGAGGNLGMAQVARAPGDGYTVLLSSSSVTVNPSLYTKMPFDVEKDLIPVTKAGGSPNSWLVNPSFPAKTMKEMIDLFKKEPGKYSVGSPGAGTTPSLSIEQLKHDLKVDFVTVPFAGGGPMTQSVLGGHVPIVVRRHRQLGGADQGGQDPRARHHRQAAAGDPARHPDARRAGDQGPGGRDHDRRVRAGRIRRRRSSICCKRKSRRWSNRPTSGRGCWSLASCPKAIRPRNSRPMSKADIAKWKRVIEPRTSTRSETGSDCSAIPGPAERPEPGIRCIHWTKY